MKKCIKIQLLTVGIVIGLSVSALCSCSTENQPVAFEDEMFLAGNGWSGAEDAELDCDSKEMAEQIVVYICGAVKRPGVFTLPKGSRVNDVLEAAGGFAENAARSSVNLAARLEDEEMICVLTLEELLEKEHREQAENNGLIDINTADMDTLCDLPGIGESKARDIVLYRKENGAFRIKEDIMKVEGIKENLYQKICDLITVK